MVPGTRRLSATLIREFGRALDAARIEVLRAAGVTEEELGSLGEREVGAPVEDAARTETQRILGRLDDREQAELDAIDTALQRLRAGAFGLCETCRGEIPIERLRAIPTARRCLTCQGAQEAHQ
jgi:RNA polymerase-binding transcription factor